jgi:hypothetical protein
VKDFAIKGEYSSLYSGGGKLALVDGLRELHILELEDGRAIKNQDFEAIVDRGSEKDITYIGADFSPRQFDPWIMMPKYVSYAVFNDNVNFAPVVKFRIPFPILSKSNNIGV